MYSSVSVPSREVEKGSEDKFFTVFNPDTKTFFLQFAFKNQQDRQGPKVGGGPPSGAHANIPGPSASAIDNMISQAKIGIPPVIIPGMGDRPLGQPFPLPQPPNLGLIHNR